MLASGIPGTNGCAAIELDMGVITKNVGVTADCLGLALHGAISSQTNE